MSGTEERIAELTLRWADAEERGDVDALDALTTDDFTMVGPVGIVMKKEQWRDRYRTDGFVTRSLRWVDVETRDYGDAVVAIGVHDQRTEINGKPIGRTCRTTLIAVRRGEKWLLAGMHLSPLRG